MPSSPIAGSPSRASAGERRPGIVHRLDKDTSGLLVAAKNDAAHQALAADFAARRIDRHYLAVVWGMPAPREGEIEGAIGRHPVDRKRMAVVSRGGRAALTRYRVVARPGAGRRAWWNAGWPRAGPTRSGSIWPPSAIPCWATRSMARRRPSAGPASARPGGRLWRGFRRQALHAASLGFRHPRTGAWLAFESPLPPDLQLPY